MFSHTYNVSNVVLFYSCIPCSKRNHGISINISACVFPKGRYKRMNVVK